MWPPLSLSCLLPVSFPNLSVSGASFVPFLGGISHIVLFVLCPSILFLSVSCISLLSCPSSVRPFPYLFSVSCLCLASLLSVVYQCFVPCCPPLACPHLAKGLLVPSRRCVAISANKTRITRMTFRSELNCLAELLSRSMDDTSTPGSSTY